MTTSQTIKVGRFGRDITVAAPKGFTLDGDRLSLRGWAYGTSQEQAQALRQQCLGLADNIDEPVVPVICSWDSTYDGYYTVLRASAEIDPADDARFRVRYQIELQRVASWTMPRTEIVLRGVTRSGCSGLVGTPLFWHAQVDSWRGYTTSSTGITAYGAGYGVTEDGDVLYYVDSAALSNATVTVTTSAGTYYDGAVKFQQGTSLYVVNGRQSFNYPASWRLTNGLFRVQPASNSAYMFKVQVQGSHSVPAWGNTYDIELGYATGGGLTWTTFSTGAPYALRVLRNSPEECIIRLQYQFTNQGASAALDAQQVDIAMRRGEYGCRVYFKSLGGTVSRAWGFGFRPQTTSVSTSVDQKAVLFSSADSAGDKFLMVTAQSVSVGTATGRLARNASDDDFDAFVGAYIGDATADSAGTWEARYYAAMSEVQRVTLP